MDDIINFILNKMPAGFIVFGQGMRIMFSNRQADLFFKRYKPPEEIENICKRIFNAISASELKEMFPGEIYVYKKLEGSRSRWTFKFEVYENPQPLVCVFITEESLASKIDLNKVRLRYKLTRKEQDVIRRVLKGLKNTDVAEEMEISEQTVKDHLSNIYMKLDVENRFALVQFLLNFPVS